MKKSKIKSKLKSKRINKMFTCKCGCKNKLFIQDWDIDRKEIIIGSGHGKTATFVDNCGVVVKRKDIINFFKLME